MTFPDFDPVIFQIGPFAIRWYALAYIAGIALGWLYVRRLARNLPLWGPRAPVATNDQVEDLVLWATLGVIVGGRLGYVLFYDTATIWQDPLQIVQIWRGGMSFHGGLIGVILAFLYVSWRHKIDLLKVSDLAAPVIPIGLFFGRLANFVNAELWGRETYAPWGVVFCNDTIRENANGVCPAGEIARHPSQLYEAGLEGLFLLLILWVCVYRLGFLKRRGLVTGIFLAGYAIFRMTVETVREPDAVFQDWALGPLTMGMLLSLPMLLGGLWLIIQSRGPKGEPTAGAANPRADAQTTKTVEARVAGASAPSVTETLTDDDDAAAVATAAAISAAAAHESPGGAASTAKVTQGTKARPKAKSAAKPAVAKAAPPKTKPTLKSSAKTSRAKPKPKPAK